MAKPKKVLVVGSGGREHALALALLASESVGEVIVSPGNAGLGAQAHEKPLRRVEGRPLDVAKSERVDLVVVGPEGPLCDGLVDELAAAGILAFGPSRRAARLEASKVFMKEFAARHGIPTGRFEVVRDAAEAERAVLSFAMPPVVKADGLCAGKGVVVAATHDEALAAARRMLSGDAFGDAGRTVLVEERIAGAEASVHGICDGERFFLLPAAQDHKRVADGDRGPNTGGMGAYAPAPVITPSLAARIEREIFERTLAGMASEDSPFRGALFAGIMVTPEGEPKLLEFNVRFGDPETQVLTLVLEGDFAETLASAARGELDGTAMRVSLDHAVCIVLAAHGYPESPRAGDAISGLNEAERVEGATVFHAGTAVKSGQIVTSGGRVLGVAARGASLREAHERAYRAADCIHFEGKQLRRDIAARALSVRP